LIGSEAVRVRQSASASTDPAVLAGFACDPSVTVRASLALNPAAPDAANAMLARDPDVRVRELLARKLGSLLPNLSENDRDTLHHRTWGLLTQLAADEAERVRAAIAAEVKDLPDAPRDLILRLANDSMVTVCEPVILFSPMLGAADLVALVASAPGSGTREAVARRSNLPEAVSDAIAASADDRAIRALLCNPSAQIREATLDALVVRAADHDNWQDPLIRRPVLSAQAMRMLSEIVAGHLLEVLAARVDMPNQLRERVRERLAGTIEPAAPASPEDRLLAAAEAGDTRGAIALLAERAEVLPDLVEQAATLRSTKALVALTWKAGLSMRVAVAMQSLLARAQSSVIIRPGPGDSFPLSVEEMKWQLTFLAGAAQSAAVQGAADQGKPGDDTASQDRTRQGKVGHGRTGQGNTGQGNMGQGKAGQGTPDPMPTSAAPGQAWFSGVSGSRALTR